jgi:hypothetical protein
MQLVINSLKKDAAIIRAERAKKKGAEISKELIQLCPMEVNRYGTHTPKKGWKQGSDAVMAIGILGNLILSQIRSRNIESITKDKLLIFRNISTKLKEWLVSQFLARWSYN